MEGGEPLRKHPITERFALDETWKDRVRSRTFLIHFCRSYLSPCGSFLNNLQDIVISINLNCCDSDNLYTFFCIFSEVKVGLVFTRAQKIIDLLVIDFKVSAFEGIFWILVTSRVLSLRFDHVEEILKRSLNDTSFWLILSTLYGVGLTSSCLSVSENAAIDSFKTVGSYRFRNDIK